MKPWSLIPDTKRKKILQACIEEFANHGYLRASTNEIIKKAEISKGLLFHYFGNKKNLYISILDLIIEKMQKEFLNTLEYSSSDIFQRLLDWTKRKFQIFYNNPLEYQILVTAFIDPPEELKEEIASRYHQLSEIGYANFLKNIDYSLFRSDIDPKKAVDLIIVSLEGLSNKYMQLYKGQEDKGLKELGNTMKDLEEYFYMLKVGLYPQHQKK
ncbi:hypothetical protein BHF71_07390 [Vulcanibacillus modesticaldus]|uniref:HTH tetR-type domain-containing protein n=1 Tax=Vulcanibacillus modesticaldus TaxID=337097 RepID=A0A1D2YWB1_9BACI|nr:hypothetical protein BHF71_07390 [Vulcanibacillus modesticaldus]